MSESNTEYHVNTDEILKELQNEGHEIAGKEPEVPSQEEPTPEKVEEPTEEPEAEAPVEEQVVDSKPKEPTLIPAWKAKITQDKLEKENERLRVEIEAFRRNPTPETRQATQASMDNIRALAEKAGLEVDERQEEFFRNLAESITSNAVPKDMLQNLQALQQQREVDYLETQFDQEFSKDVAPLIKEQYEDMWEGVLASLREKQHDLAFTDT